MAEQENPDEELPSDGGKTQAQDGAIASSEGVVAVEKAGIYVGGGVGGDVLGAGARKITITAEQAYQVHGLPNPYLGLRSYTYADRESFAGREPAIRQAIAKLTNPADPVQLLFVTGASGSGKSSFVQAGLLPALEAHYAQRHKSVNHAVFRPSESPLAMLGDALEQLGFPPISADHLAGFTAEDFSHYLSENTPKNQVNVVVVDQFEECFTQSTREPRERLFALLAGLGSFSETHTQVIVTLRADYLDELFAEAKLWQVAKQGIELRAMTESELKQAIQQPLFAAGEQGERYREKRFEPALLDHLAKDAAQDPAYLPLLQVTLLELWTGGSLVFERYGQLSDAIRQRAEEVYGFEDYDSPKPSQSRSPVEQDAILELFLDLIEVSLDDDFRRNVRRRRVKTELVGDSNQRSQLVDSLVNARLLSISCEMHVNARVDVVDIIHESLIANWTRLREALASKRQNLQRRTRFELALAEWLANDRKDDYLLTGIRLAEGCELNQIGDVAMRSSQAKQFLQASLELRDAQAARQEAQRQRELEQAKELAAAAVARQAAEEEARLNAEQLVKVKTQSNQRLRKRFWVAVGLSVLAVVIAIIAGLGFQRASEQARIAVATTLATNAQELSSRGIQDLSLALAMEANKKEATSLTRQTLASVGYYTPGTRRLLKGHQGAVKGVGFLSNGQTALSGGGDDGVAILWDLQSAQEINRYTGHSAGISAVAVHPDTHQALLGYQDGVIILLEIADNGVFKEINRLSGHHDAVNSLAFSPDGKSAVSGSSDHSVILWELNEYKPVWQATSFSDIVNTVAFNPKRPLIAAGSDDNSLCWWNSDTGERIGCFPSEAYQVAYGVKSIAFHPAGDRLIIGFGMFGLSVFNIDKNVVTKSFSGHSGSGLSVQYSPDGQRALSGSNDNKMILWKPEQRGDLDPLLTRYTGHTDAINNVVFSPDGRQALSAASDGSIRLWDLNSGPQLKEWSPDVRLVDKLECTLYHLEEDPSSSSELKMHLWNALDPSQSIWLERNREASLMTVSPSKREVLVGAWSDPLEYYNLSTGKLIMPFEYDGQYVTSLSFTPDNRYTLASSYAGPGSTPATPQNIDKIVLMWDVQTGKVFRRFTGTDQTIMHAAISPDGHTALLGAFDGSLIVWDLQSGKELNRLEEHMDAIYTVDFNAQGNLALTGANDGSLILWDTRTWKSLRRFNGHTAKVNTAIFSPEGLTAISGSDDSSIILWDVNTGALRARFIGHTGAIGLLSYCDEEHFLSEASDGTARLWSLREPEDIAKWVQENRYIRELSCDERRIYEIKPYCD